jgi:hypothetical protein
VSTFAAQAQNGHWQWYVEQLGGPRQADGYIGFIRGELPEVQAVAPDELPTSRLFAGIGQAFLNANLTNADESVQVVFKSSPFGTQSHGYEANNSFLLWAYGKRLLIRSGYRDSYGSKHHKEWMWSTRSVNNITVDGRGQGRRTAKAQGEIIDFKTTPSIDIVVGEAGSSYEPPLERFTRSIIFVKPELVVVYDHLDAVRPATYEYRLHAVNKIDASDQHHIRARNEDVVCDIDFLTPTSLTFSQTNQYDPNPRARIKLREWHLTARTQDKKRQMIFVTLYRPHRIEDGVPDIASLEQIKGGYLLKAKVTGGRLSALLPTSDDVTMRADSLESKGRIKCRLEKSTGQVQIIGLGE